MSHCHSTKLTCSYWLIFEVCRHVLRHLLRLTHLSGKINDTITKRCHIIHTDIQHSVCGELQTERFCLTLMLQPQIVFLLASLCCACACCCIVFCVYSRFVCEEGNSRNKYLTFLGGLFLKGCTVKY